MQQTITKTFKAKIRLCKNKDVVLQITLSEKTE